VSNRDRIASATRAAGIPVVVGDARHPEILADLGIGRARAVIAATSDDLVNIAVALNARAIRPGIPIVLTSGYVRPEDTAAEIILKPRLVADLGPTLHRLLTT